MDVAKPRFQQLIQAIDPEIARWFRYDTFEVQNKNQLYFVFDNSNNQIQFKVYAGVFMGEHHEIQLLESFSDIYDFFKQLKYDCITI